MIRALLLALLLAPLPALAQQTQPSPQPSPTPSATPTPSEPQGKRGPARWKERQRVRFSRLNQVGSRPHKASALVLHLPAELVERALIDLELHTPRVLGGGTVRMRRVLRGCELRMSWTLNQRFAGQQLVWKLGPAQGPTVTGASQVKGSDEDELCDVRCVERKVTPRQQGYRFEARFRLTLGKRTYDLLLGLNVDLSEPDTRPALRYQANWRGPFGEGKGTLRDGFKRPGNKRPGNKRPGKRKGE